MVIRYVIHTTFAVFSLFYPIFRDSKMFTLKKAKTKLVNLLEKYFFIVLVVVIVLKFSFLTGIFRNFY